MATISTVVTRGYGVGTVSEVALLGFGSQAGVADVPVVPPAVIISDGDGTLSWRDAVDAEFRKKHLTAEVTKAVKELKKVEAKIKTVEKKLQVKRTEGILANLLTLEMKKDEIRNQIQGFKLELDHIKPFLRKMEEDEDERDVEMLLLS